MNFIINKYFDFFSPWSDRLTLLIFHELSAKYSSLSGLSVFFFSCERTLWKNLVPLINYHTSAFPWDSNHLLAHLLILDLCFSLHHRAWKRWILQGWDLIEIICFIREFLSETNIAFTVCGGEESMGTGKVWFELRYQHSLSISANVYIVRKANKIWVFLWK